MLQDLAFGKLENEFHNTQPMEADVVVCFREGEVLLQRAADDALTLPRFPQVDAWARDHSWQPYRSR